jgi:pimeloyl-ACP methyl ester carboxylesterase
VTYPVPGAYLDAGGVHTWYDLVGPADAPSVLLLHGGLSSSDDWTAQVPALAARHRVILADRRGHGRTPDVEGAITYAGMAADTVAFLEALEPGPVALVGWSDGALVGLEVARRRPDLARKLVMIGQYVHPDGCRPWFAEVAASMTPSTFPAAFRDHFMAHSPDGAEHDAVIFEKLARLWRTEPVIPVPELEDVSVPTLVLAGDDDIVTVEHAAAIVAAIPNAQLAIVPGASHASPIEKPEVVNRLLLDFLADEQPPKLFTPAALG